jgi:hypothetical protein
MNLFLVRSSAARLVLVVALLLAFVATAGRAHAAPVSSAPVASPVPEARVAGGLFTPTRTDGGIAWSAHWVLTLESSAELESYASRLIRFASALDEGQTVEPTFGVVPFVEDGRVVGVVVDRSAADGRTVSGVVYQRLAHDGRSAGHLGAPVAAGASLQIVDMDLGAGTRFEVETGRILERHVGFVAPPGIGHAPREEARRLTGYEARVNGAALYVRGDDVRAANGLSATVVTPSSRAHGTTLAIGLVFAAMVGALLVAMRRLRHAASVERADAMLAAEVEALDRVAR